MSQLLDVTAETFQQEVIEGSADHYVVVDFWAPWCNPCKILKPMLEQLAPQYGYTLAKVNTEEQQQLATQYGVRGIPDVRLFHQGQEVDRFSGALPEGEVRQFLEKYMQSQLGQEIARLEQLQQQNGNDAAIRAGYDQLLLQHERNSDIRISYANYLLDSGALEEANSVLTAIPMGDTNYNMAQSLLMFGQFHQACAQKNSATGIDLEFANASCATIQNDYASALQGFLGIVQKDRKYRDDAARKAMLVIFTLLGSEEPLVKQYQRKLAMFMH